MNTIQKFLLVGAFGLLCTTFVLIAIGKTNQTYKDISASDSKFLSFGSKPKVLGATIAVITITSPGSGSTVAAGTASVPLTATTDQMASCRYSGNSTDEFSVMSPFDQTGSTTHASILSPLTNGNAYTIYVQCQDSNGNVTPKAVTYFTVAVPAATAQDTVAPIISNIKMVNISASSSVISWQTDEATDAQIEYGPIDAYGSFTQVYDGSAKTTTHTVTLNSLLPSFTYHYRLRSRDAAGNLGVTGDMTLTTLPQTSSLWFTANSMPPQTTSGDFRIYQAYANFISQDSATIYWSTDLPSMGQVLYGPTSGYGTSTITTDLLTITHGMDLKGLTPNTTYHYQIVATDYNGHKGTSGDGWFTTTNTSTPQTVPAAPLVGQNTLPAQGVGISMPTQTVVLPAKVKDWQLVKFSKGPAVFLVKPDGLHPFDSMANLKRYQKQWHEKIRYYTGAPDKYTISPVPASVVLGY